MTNILAIDTSTDACSVALCRDEHYSEIYQLAPREHSQRLFPMLHELLSSGDLRAQQIDAIAYACGPGSFTGLRIAASAVQGLAFTSGLPAIPISTLACQAQTALSLGTVSEQDLVLSMLDARMNEVYWGYYTFEDGLAVQHGRSGVCAIQDIPYVCHEGSLIGVGSGFSVFNASAGELFDAIDRIDAQLLPRAIDLIPLALERFKAGDLQPAEKVRPVYVRNEISWKKLSEQGKR